MLSVLIPAARFTELLLDSVSSLDPTRWPEGAEVIIGLDSKEPSAHEERLIRAAPGFADIVHLGGSTPLGPATIRNRLAGRAEGDYFLFVDSDVVLSDSVMRVFAERISSLKKNSVTTFRIRPIVQTEVARFFSREVFLPRNVRGNCYFPSAVIGMWKELWENVGGFDESFPAAGGEDWEWWQRAHMVAPTLEVHLMSDLVASHDNPSTVGNLVRRAWRYGLQAHRYHSKHVPKWRLGDRALGLLLLELAVPLNRGLAKSEGVARRFFGLGFGYPLSTLKVFTKNSLGFPRDSQSAILESKQPFLLMERLIFRLEGRGFAYGINRDNDRNSLPARDRRMPATATLTVINQQEVRLVRLEPGEHFEANSGANRGRMARSLRFFWRLNHRTAAALGPIWHKIRG